MNWVLTRGLGHSATYIPEMDSLVVFGGENDTHGPTDELFQYFVDSDSWKRVDYDHPTDHSFARTRHAACLAEDPKELVISGGCDEKGSVTNDLWFLNVYTGELDGPYDFVHRYDHTIHMYKGKIWAFGGLSPDMDRVTEVAWYNTNTDTIGTLHITMSSPSRPLLSTQGKHLYSPGLVGSVIDVVVPGSFPVTPSITALDLDVLNWRHLAEDCSEFFSGYSWFHMAITHTTMFLIGQPEAQKNDEEKLTHMLVLDLSELGYLDSFGSRSASPSLSESASGTVPAEYGIGGTIGNDMYEFYKRSEMCDFEIVAVDGPHRPSLTDDASKVVKSTPLKAHKMVLAARWPHFKRIMMSGMSESQTGKLYIPEPIEWVGPLIEYMYRDSIEGYSVNEITGLLVLANVYELPRLRKLCMEFISRTEYNPATAVIIWERAKMAAEPVVSRNAAICCLANWGQVVRSEEFHQLSHESVLMLCMEASEKSVVTDYYKNIQQDNEDCDIEDDAMEDSPEPYSVPDDDSDVSVD